MNERFPQPPDEPNPSLERFGIKPIEGTKYLKADSLLLETDNNSISGVVSIEKKKGDARLADVVVSDPFENAGKNLELVFNVSTPYGLKSASQSGWQYKTLETSPPEIRDTHAFLLDHGFHQLGTNPGEGIYELADKNGRKAALVLANNKLEYFTFSTKPIEFDRGDLLFRPGTTITNRTQELSSSNQWRTRYTFENDLLSFRMGTRYPSDIKFKKPITEDLFPPDETSLYSKQAHEKGTMNIGLPNTTNAIKELQTINSLPIEQLEEIMRPGKSSLGGFLDENESLVKILAEDNETVVTQGLTHQEIAQKLFMITDIVQFIGRGSFEFEGQRFEVSGLFTKGMQFSPFSDGTGSSSDAKLTNLENGKTINFSFLHPHLIYRYGFYEGHGTPYRLEPQDVIDIFKMKPKGNREDLPQH